VSLWLVKNKKIKTKKIQKIRKEIERERERERERESLRVVPRPAWGCLNLSYGPWGWFGHPKGQTLKWFIFIFIFVILAIQEWLKHLKGNENNSVTRKQVIARSGRNHLIDFGVILATPYFYLVWFGPIKTSPNRLCFTR
jgi:hypothetical protein